MIYDSSRKTTPYKTANNTNMCLYNTIQFSLVSTCWESYHTALTTMLHQTFSTYIPFAGPRLFFTSQHMCTATGVLSVLNLQGRLDEKRSLEQQSRDHIYTLKFSHIYMAVIRATLTWRHEPLTAQTPHHLWTRKTSLPVAPTHSVKTITSHTCKEC